LEINDDLCSNKIIITDSDILSNERGVALLLVLVMLLLLSILGVTALKSSTSELSSAGNFRNMMEAFYTADAIQEYSQFNETIYKAMAVPGDSWSGSVVFNSTGIVTVTDGATAPTNSVNTAQVSVVLTGLGPTPRGSGFDETFKGYYYDLEVTGYAPNNSEVAIESKIVRIQQ
jgi:type IV pilus assembly protein PilX